MRVTRVHAPFLNAFNSSGIHICTYCTNSSIRIIDITDIMALRNSVTEYPGHKKVEIILKLYIM